jgi:hypothetical protein
VKFSSTQKKGEAEKKNRRKKVISLQTNQNLTETKKAIEL